MKKNSILTFLFACIPGAGQMYYGYMRRGLSVAIVFWLGCVVGIMLPPLLVMTPVIWMFAFFDTYDLIRYVASGSPKPDDYLWGDRFDWNMLVRMTPSASKLVGWGLILVGAWVICAQWIAPLISELCYMLGVEYAAVGYYLRQVPTLLVAVVLIWLGLRLLHRSKAPHGSDLPPYPGEHDEHDGHDHPHGGK